jgi:phenylpropionate dioxygenase-like ring-hydroxylating dioxygenase large terminal subunit
MNLDEGDQEDSLRASKRKLISQTYLRNAWYVAMWSEALSPGQLIARTILKEPLVFFRREDGTVVALRDRCAHRSAPLSMGKVLPGDRLQCPYHGLEFGPNGNCVHNPHGNGKIVAANQVRSFPVVEKHGLVWVWTGGQQPNQNAIPDFSVLDTPEELAVTKRDCIIVQANYELVTDNLLDLSHTSYLHEGILGNLEMVDAEITVKQECDSVIVGRASRNAPIPGMFKALLPGGHQRVDKWNTIRWTAPSNLLLQSGVAPPGTAPESGTGYYGIHLLTPETDSSTYYHFTAVRWNVLTQGENLNREIRENLSVTRRFAFAEQDAPVIEAQQKRIESAEESVDPVLLSIDVGPARYKRILEGLIRAEAQALSPPARRLEVTAASG